MGGVDEAVVEVCAPCYGIFGLNFRADTDTMRMIISAEDVCDFWSFASDAMLLENSSRVYVAEENY